MGFHLPPEIKEYFDFLRGLAAIVGFAAIGLMFIAFGCGDEEFWKKFIANLGTISIIFGIVILFFVIFGYWITNEVQLWVNIVRKRSNFIVEKQIVKVDIEEKGRIAYYWERRDFFKIAKNREDFVGELNTSGKIYPTGQFNCDPIIQDSNHSSYGIKYQDYEKQLKPKYFENVVKSRNKFFMFSARIENGFIMEEEQWTFSPRKYVKDYELRITFPLGCKLESLRICKVIGTQEFSVSNIIPIRTVEHGRITVYLQLSDCMPCEPGLSPEKKESIRLKWKWSFD